MLKTKKIAAIALAASVSFSFFNAGIIAKADEDVKEYTQIQGVNNSESEDVIWGEDSNYTWNSCDWCIINGVGFGINRQDNTAFLSAVSKNMEELIIPNKIKVDGIYYDVTMIGECSIPGFFGIKSVRIPKSITKIGDSAFALCDSLDSITIPNSITSIENNTFIYCSKLSSIAIPDSVKSIGHGAFHYCSNLNSIWTSEAQYNEFKDIFCESSNPILIESNLYHRYNYTDDVIKIKADSVKCFEILNDGTKKEIAITQDDAGNFVHDPSSTEAGTKYYVYEAVKDGVSYESPRISVQFSTQCISAR